MLLPGSVYVITWFCACYYLGLCMLIPGTMYVITWVCVCYYLGLSLLLPGSVYVITWVWVCYYLGLCMLLPGSAFVITWFCICYYLGRYLLLPGSVSASSHRAPFSPLGHRHSHPLWTKPPFSHVGTDGQWSKKRNGEWSVRNVITVTAQSFTKELKIKIWIIINIFFFPLWGWMVNRAMFNKRYFCCFLLFFCCCFFFFLQKIVYLF